MVPFNDPRRRFKKLEETVIAGLAAVVRSGGYVGGSLIEQFEREFAEFHNANYCVSVANGTDALEIALRGCGVQQGDEVITVANAGGYATTACEAIGAIPVFADVDPLTCQVDVNSLTLSLSRNTKAVVVTHLYGYMNDVAAIRSLLDRSSSQSVYIVEDCAQAHGAMMRGMRAGSLGDVTAFSFYPTKNIGAIGDAGAILSSNIEIATRARQLRQYGWDSKYLVAIAGGRNSRMDPLQVPALLPQLTTLDDANAIRRDICQQYQQNLPSGWSMVCDAGERFVGHLAVVQAPSLDARSRAMEFLKHRGIGHGVHFPILDCDQPGWQGHLTRVRELPVSRRLKDVIFSIPCFPELSSSEVNEVADALRHFT